MSALRDLKTSDRTQTAHARKALFPCFQRLTSEILIAVNGLWTNVDNANVNTYT